jgi:hypothetical protein
MTEDTATAIPSQATTHTRQKPRMLHKQLQQRPVLWLIDKKCIKKTQNGGEGKRKEFLSVCTLKIKSVVIASVIVKRGQNR